MHQPGVMPVLDYLNNEKMVQNGMVTRDEMKSRKKSMGANSRYDRTPIHSRSKSIGNVDIMSHISKKSGALTNAGQSLVTGVTKQSTISALKKQLEEER